MTLSITKTEKPNQPEDKEVVLSVEGVSKKFCRDLKRSLFYGVQDITTDLVGLRKNKTNLRPKEFWALDDVSFQLRKGEALGLVGKNGSGKSTLLRIIAGLIKPDKGKVRVKGKVAPLIALGAGFNPILTGRENIYANMSILGLSKKEIDARFDEVVEFAEIGEAIDSPVRTYSSGMAARLGFATAIHTEPDILLIDEVLAVGDVKFRAKCYTKLHELRQKKISFILVNHNPIAILNVCDLGVCLSSGKVISIGKAEEIILKYEESLFMNNAISSSNSLQLPSKPKAESFGLDILSICFKDNQGNNIKKLLSGQPLSLCVAFQAHKQFDQVNLGLRIQELGGETGIILVINGWQEQEFFDVMPGKYEIHIQMPYLGLKPGMYRMKIDLKQKSLNSFDVIESFQFKVETNEVMSNCKFYQPRSWKMIEV